jgi:hypothetical protein
MGRPVLMPHETMENERGEANTLLPPLQMSNHCNGTTHALFPFQYTSGMNVLPFNVA